MHACAARLQAAAARDEGERMVGEMAAATRQRAQAALQLEAVHAQATAWEQERRTRVNARRAELEALLGSVGTEITEITEITSTGAGVALKDDAGVAAPADADAALKSAREAVERASEALAQLREEASATLAQMQTRVRRSFTEAQAAAERVIEADAAAASSRARLDSAQQRAAALRASVSAWGWDALRLKAARALADAGEVSRQGILRDAAREAPRGVDIEADLARKGLVPLEQPFTFTVSKAGKDGLVTEEAAAEAGVHAEIAEITEIAEIDTSEAIVRSLQNVAQYMRASAMAARRRLDELPPRSEDQHAHGHTHTHGQPRGEGHVCGTCGQLVSADHLHAQHAALHAAAQAAEQAARASEAAASRAQAAADGARLASVLAQLGRVQSEMKAAEAARVSAEAEASARRDALKQRRAEAHSLEQESADYR